MGTIRACIVVNELVVPKGKISPDLEGALTKLFVFGSMRLKFRK
jgi:hypothetical protein